MKRDKHHWPCWISKPAQPALINHVCTVLALCMPQHHLEGLVMTQVPALGWTQLALHHSWLHIWLRLA